MNWETITKLEREGRLPIKEASPLLGKPIVVETILITSDQHGRFLDRPAWDCILRILDTLRIDRFIFNGDLLDCYELSKYAKNPDEEEPVQDDFNHAKAMFGDVRSRLDNDEPIDFNPGNHEARYEMYLNSDAKRLRDIEYLKMPNMLEVEKYGVTMHGKDGFAIGEWFRVYHGEVVRKHSGVSAQHELQAWGSSGTSGHVHRLAIHRYRTPMGIMSWSESGCLCELSPSYMTRTPNWSHGAILAFLMSDGTVQQEEIIIQEGYILGSLGRLVGDTLGKPSLKIQS